MSEVWLVGSGQMALEYTKVLNKLEKHINVFGRGIKSADKYTAIVNEEVILTSITEYSKVNNILPKYIIITVSAENLARLTIEAIKLGIKNILVEKPLGITTNEVHEVSKLAKENNVNLFIGFNRRFFSSTKKALELIEKDGGVKSIHFEFTEWPNVFTDPKNSKIAKEKWLLCNSSHVIDLAFFLAGKPKEICSFISGGTKYHPSGSIFSGAGITESDALFSYHANWESSGRWNIEVMTNQRRFIFAPMEELKVQEISSVKQMPVHIDNTLDKEFKPGLFLQTKAFLNDDINELYTIEMLYDSIGLFNKIAGYHD